jgi:histidinol-phosphate/aromatic aminotransferase/cobyric acid decarboxylase-like protein
MRVAYAVGPESLVADLRRATPPWCVGLPAQVAAVAALESEEWYRGQRAQVHAWRVELRRDLERALQGSGVELFDSGANWLLLRLPELAGELSRSAAFRLVERCRRRGVFLRDAGATSRVLANRFVRIAVRTPSENHRIVAAIVAALEETGERPTRAATIEARAR